MKEATWILYSFDVKMDAPNACRKTDKMKMNHGNTICMGGVTGLMSGSKKAEDLLMQNALRTRGRRQVFQ